ncbi:hypothetical protein [Ruminococcus sp.]|uniref:hypothetical protein n=1 Tax=Ruminococcus sp. TaxID=41978 RepID=UPI0025F06F47|nr:hypothetical protein [Ruminococcus sp.]MCI6615926.1 hypothetical protein [Ruminococcus sp.]
MAKNKKSSAKAKQTRKKQSKKLQIIISCVIVAIIIAASAILTVSCSSQQNRNNELCTYQWIPSTAKNASGDEVEMSEIYNTNYTSYQGSLTFNEDGRFSLWLSPGTADDGTHTGSFAVNSDNEIEAFFDDGTNTKFKIERKNGTANGIIINYNDYEIYFSH